MSAPGERRPRKWRRGVLGRAGSRAIPGVVRGKWCCGRNYIGGGAMGPSVTPDLAGNSSEARNPKPETRINAQSSNAQWCIGGGVKHRDPS